MRKLSTCFAASLLTVAAASVDAHVHIAETQTKFGETVKVVLRVGHGCSGSPTTALRVIVPEGLSAAKPMPKPGWAVALQTRPAAPAASSSPGAAESEPREIVWRDGSLADAYTDEFSFVATVRAAPGLLAVPVVQECQIGRTEWTGAAGSVTPAPVIRIVAGSGRADAHSHASHGGHPAANAGAANAAPSTASAPTPTRPTTGGPVVEAAWLRPIVAGQSSGGGYLTITSPTSDRLVGASSPIAKRVEIHEMSMDGQIMRMRPVSGVDLPARQKVALQPSAPGGLHLMFLSPSRPINEGETVPLTLKLEKAGLVNVVAKVSKFQP